MPPHTPIERTPLDDGALPPAARKLVGAAATEQLRTMAARGLAPLPPSELLVALYQLSVGANANLADTAKQTFASLPEALLMAPLSTKLDERVLDWAAEGLVGRSKLLGVVLLNSALTDESFVMLAARCGEAELELIAGNEQRLLRHPPIIAALYLNPKTRMSTAVRAVELAVRNGVTVEGVPGFDEVKAAIESDGPTDADTDETYAAVVEATTTMAAALGELSDEERAQVLAAAADEAARGLLPDEEIESELAGEAAENSPQNAGENPEKSAEARQSEKKKEAKPNDKMVVVSRLKTSVKLRLASVGNAFIRASLVRDRNRVVAMAAVRNPAVNENEAEKYASNRALHDEVIRYIASQRQFTKRYSVKVHLCHNPKTPLQTAMGLMSHLTPKDLRTVARSKGVPSALAKAAQSLMQKREAK